MTPFYSQFVVVLSPQLAAISVGGAVTYPTLLMEQLQANDTYVHLDMDTKSWIGSIYGLAGIPSILMPVITQKIGRKWGFIITCLCLLLGWILTYRATTITELLISESIQGLGLNSLFPVCFMGFTEMVAPQYRAATLPLYGISQAFGMTACGILGRYLHYKTVSLIMLAPAVAAIAVGFMWPESPYWFACKGEFDKCERAFIKLRGTGDLSKQELLELISAQKQNQILTRKKAFTINSLCSFISRRDFYMPNIHIFVLFLLLFWSGIDVIYVYFIEIVTKSTKNDDATFYGSIVMYLIVLGGLGISNVLMTKFKFKTLLTCSSCAVTACLLCCSLISGLQTLGVLSEDSLLLMLSLIAYTTCSSLCFHGTVYAVASELIPVKHRSLGGALFIMITSTLNASSLKLSPYISLYLGLWCTLLIYALNVIICIWFIRKYVPETKGVSLQAIEDFYNYGRYIRRDSGGEVAYSEKLLTVDI